MVKLQETLLIYWEFMRIKFLKMLAYRGQYFTGIITYTVNIGAYYFLWDAIFSSKRVVGGFTLREMITYTAVGWMARTFYFNNLDREISYEIRDGRIATELIRPYNYQLVKLAQALGEALFRLSLFTIPGVAVVYMIFGVSLPLNWQTFFLYVLSVLGSFFINSQINFIVGLSSFYTLNSFGVIRTKRAVVDILSGLLLPLTVFPEWAQSIMKLLPFQGIVFLPNMIYTGKLVGSEAWNALGIQLFWMLVLFAIGQYIWQRAIKKLVIQGG
jgi:ABC-2 type transport system permease protein